MRVFDASSIVYAWDNYPIEVFPPLWNWIAAQVAAEEITMSQVCFDEVGHVSPDCAQWLSDQGMICHGIGNAEATNAMEIKAALGIQNDNYHSDGVDENDIIAIATAKSQDVHLVSDEARQPALPINIRKYKIPAVCNLQGVQVPCLSFLEYLKAINQVFG